jgi:hypothetical protein
MRLRLLGDPASPGSFVGGPRRVTSWRQANLAGRSRRREPIAWTSVTVLKARSNKWPRAEILISRQPGDCEAMSLERKAKMIQASAARCARDGPSAPPKTCPWFFSLGLRGGSSVVASALVGISGRYGADGGAILC